MKRWRIPAGGAAAAVLLVSVFHFAVSEPRTAKIAELEAHGEQLRSQQIPLRREIRGLEQVAAREADFQTALERLDQLIPGRLAQADFLGEMQQAATTSGVELVSVTFGDPKPPQAAQDTALAGTVLVAMPVTVIVEGRFRGMIELLRRVEAEFKRAVLVGTVAFTEADSGFPTLTGTWSGQAYALLQADDPLLGNPAKARTAPAPAGSTPTSSPSRGTP